MHRLSTVDPRSGKIAFIRDCNTRMGRYQELDFGPIRATLRVLSDAIPFTIENLIPNGIT